MIEKGMSDAYKLVVKTELPAFHHVKSVLSISPECNQTCSVFHQTNSAGLTTLVYTILIICACIGTLKQ